MVRRALLAVMLAASVLVGGAGPVAAEYCRPVMPDHAEDAIGDTFRATIEAIQVRGAARLTYVTLAVDEVYANQGGVRLTPGPTIDVYSNPCDGFALLGLAVGDEVVMSTAALDAADGPATWNTAVWRVDGNRLRLVVLRGPGFQRVWYSTDRRTARVASMGDSHRVRATRLGALMCSDGSEA